LTRASHAGRSAGIRGGDQRDTINVAGGRYGGALRITTALTLTLLGGWGSGCTTRDPGGFPTVLKGHHDRVWTILALDPATAVTLTLDGVVMTGGQARENLAPSPIFFGNAGGGGILSVGAGGGHVTLTVRRSTITKNKARIFFSGLDGGGVFLGGSVDATFEAVSFTRNTALEGGALFAFGR
jgi:hypothetical protein